MDCEDRYWGWSEESNAEHVEELMAEVRHKFALDEPEPTAAWEGSEAGFHLSKKVDRLAAKVAEFVASDFKRPPAGFALELEAIRGLRIRQVVPQHPFAELRRQFGGTPAEGDDEPYVAIDVAAEDLLRTLVRHRLGYERRHWHVGRVIEAAAAGIVARSERGRAYLTRMLNCYVLGLDDEVIVWARSVLEAELESLLEDGVTTATAVPMAELINRAGCLGVLNGSVFEAAHRVRSAGNDTLHVMIGLWCITAVLGDLRIGLKALDRA